MPTDFKELKNLGLYCFGGLIVNSGNFSGSNPGVINMRYGLYALAIAPFIKSFRADIANIKMGQ